MSVTVCFGGVCPRAHPLVPESSGQFPLMPLGLRALGGGPKYPNLNTGTLALPLKYIRRRFGSQRRVPGSLVQALHHVAPGLTERSLRVHGLRSSVEAWRSLVKTLIWLHASTCSSRGTSSTSPVSLVGAGFGAGQLLSRRLHFPAPEPWYW